MGHSCYIIIQTFSFKGHLFAVELAGHTHTFKSKKKFYIRDQIIWGIENQLIALIWLSQSLLHTSLILLIHRVKFVKPGTSFKWIKICTSANYNKTVKE